MIRQRAQLIAQTVPENSNGTKRNSEVADLQNQVADLQQKALMLERVEKEQAKEREMIYKDARFAEVQVTVNRELKEKALRLYNDALVGRRGQSSGKLEEESVAM